MNTNDKFEVSKQRMVEENEAQYGKDARGLYGDGIVDASNAKLMGLTIEQHNRVQELSDLINKSLKIGCEQGDPSSQLAQEVCALHKEWLGYFWINYSKEAHLSLAQMYVEDPSFNEYYEKVGVGCAEFLRDALTVYCQ